MYDWLGSNKKLSLYFLLQHQATDRVAYPKDNLETHRHVLRLVKKVRANLFRLITTQMVIKKICCIIILLKAYNDVTSLLE